MLSLRHKHLGTENGVSMIDAHLVTGELQSLLSWSAQAAIMKYHRLGNLNTNLFFTVLEARGTRSRSHRDQFQVRVLSLWLADGCLFTVSSHGRENKLFCVSSSKGINPIMRAPPL